MCMHARAHVYVWVCVCVYVCAHARVCVRVCVRAGVCVRARVRACVHACARARVYVCVTASFVLFSVFLFCLGININLFPCLLGQLTGSKTRLSDRESIDTVANFGLDSLDRDLGKISVLI